jgi:ribose transport system ATP-binding protein
MALSGTAAPVLEMRGIRKAFPGVVALDGVDLTLHGGEVHILLGENGAGKSTLMKILSGAYRCDAGEILLRGQRADIRSPADALAIGIRVIYQELNLVPQLSAAENIFLGAAPTRGLGILDWRALRARTRTLLDELDLDLPLDVPVGRLSLAARQMVEIAKALKDQASVLVMDEPTSALTAKEVDQLFALIDRLIARGVAVVYITHRLDEVYRIGQRVTVLRDGRHIATQDLTGTTVDQLVRLMANREIEDHYPRQRSNSKRGQSPSDDSRQPGSAARAESQPGLQELPDAATRRPLLAVEHLSRAPMLHDITFDVYPGEVVGIAGLMGAGRTELARVLAGADRADAGSVRIGGQAVTMRSPQDAIRRGIGLLPEERKAQGLVPGLTAVRNIALPHCRRLGRWGVVSSGAETALAEPVIRDLRVKTTPTQAVRLLSGGNQQKVVLGKWLAGDARLFIFDEPTRGVDVGAKVEIYQLMNRLTDAGAAILMISSDLPEVLGMSDRILVMRQGRLVASFAGADATQERVLAAALGLPT